MTLKHRQICKKMTMLLLTLLIAIILIKKLDFNFSSIVTGVKNWWYIFYAVFIHLCVLPLLSVNRWRFFLRQYKIQESFFSLWRVMLISMFQSLILPSGHGFDLLRIYYIEKRHPQYTGKAGSTVLIERMFGMFVLCVMCLCATPFVLRSSHDWAVASTILIVCCSCLMFITLAIMPQFHNLYKGKRTGIKVINKTLDYVDSFHQAIVTFNYRNVFFSSLWFIAGYQLGAILSVFCIFRAYGYHVSFVDNMALYPIIGILSMVPITIGGFGVREGLFAFFYSMLNVPTDVSVAVSVTNYVVLLLVPAILGAILSLFDFDKTQKQTVNGKDQ
jgi:uncharacterized protein (TIRG00374 family)